MKAVILLSGGLDSAVTAYQARQTLGQDGQLFPLNISYGQIHEKEKDCAARIASSLGCDLRWIFVPIHSLVKSSLTGTGKIPSKEVEGIPSTWVPQRNSIFLALAFAYAETVGAEYIYTGFNSVDYSGYPDCRSEFVSQIQIALNLASKRFIENGKEIKIVTPLMFLSKGEIIRVGLNLGVPFQDTTSCYQGREKACGVCPSCRIRLQGFKDAGRADFIEYEGDMNG